MWLLGATKRVASALRMEGFVFSGTSIAAFGRSRIPRSTIEAYLATEYRIQGDWPLALRIGQANERLADLYRRHSVGSASVLTAWNPFSEPKSDVENHCAQGQMITEFDRLGLRHQPGHGADPTGKWPPEDSRLVLGADLGTARLLGRQFRQNGFVWAAADATPTLILLR